MKAAPQGTPPAVIQTLNEASARALNTPAMRQMLERDGIDLVADSPEHAAAFLKDEMAKWGKVVKDGNLQP
ncbi:tripartite tricarboxylate transporter substrate-binding protein [Bordetella bronchiseptica]|uniref:tripartite tricarboxylate transporter substrate-binding protein n=1 Tax=Bordetella bronchiseptica TaxID=518 RepID=UPI001F2A6CEF